jgi:hypothetical protein
VVFTPLRVLIVVVAAANHRQSLVSGSFPGRRVHPYLPGHEDGLVNALQGEVLPSDIPDSTDSYKGPKGIQNTSASWQNHKSQWYLIRTTSLDGVGVVVTRENLDPGSVLSVDQSDLSNINSEVEVSIQSHRLEEQRATEWLTFRE